ncbi:ImmA/IrrE family metallo-endopeptidase (plasmid) [Bradyrhizobium sp. Pa8]|uniref:ImmA/IrrE family metallo-endopeptidase n=1 Tax=Bradyrhizobium sp. Pa8 TaxID=3386552 RepID=UPI00403F40C0
MFHDKNGKYHICVNCAHNSRRQRFSVCHEVAHVILEIGADHSDPSWSYSRRPPGEVACDVFAAELLLPYKLFKPRVDAADMRLASIGALADEFEASRFTLHATFSRELCASSSPKVAGFAIAPDQPIFARLKLGSSRFPVAGRLLQRAGSRRGKAVRPGRSRTGAMVRELGSRWIAPRRRPALGTMGPDSNPALV